MALLYSALNLSAVKRAYSLIQTKVWRTPVCRTTSLSRIVSESLLQGKTFKSGENDLEIKVFLKCENLQKTGSFKFRGVSHFMAKQGHRALRNGFITYSTGNHAIALSQAVMDISEKTGVRVPLVVLMPKTASSAKIKMIESMGSTVILHPTTMQDCAARVEELQRETDMTLVPPSGHPYILLGQGTTMLEFQQQVAALGEHPLDAVIMPSAGGALLAGVALVCKEAKSPVDVFGAEPQLGGAALSKCRQEGRLITDPCLSTLTIADGLRSPIAKCNWEIVRHHTYVRDIFTVSDHEIRAAMRLILQDAKQVIEPSAAVPLAALLFNSRLHSFLTRKEKSINIGIILSGGNIELERLLQLLA